MKNRITLLILCFTAIAAMAQTADIEVRYEYTRPSLSGGSYTNKMTLLANSAGSKYFNDISLWTDSLESTPEGKAKLDEIIRANCLVQSPEGYEYWDLTKGPVKNIYTYVFNNNSDNTLTIYDQWGDELRFYTEPSDEMQWTLLPDSTNVILGYDCNLAESYYHGRHWKAWFAPEIPLCFGPWKLHGLPGLILKAEADGGFSFHATGLQHSDRIMSPMYSAEEYKKTDRRKAQADNEYFINNQEAILKAQNGGMAKITYSDDDGNEIAAPVYEAAKHSLEPDYKTK